MDCDSIGATYNAAVGDGFCFLGRTVNYQLLSNWVADFTAQTLPTGQTPLANSLCDGIGRIFDAADNEGSKVIILESDGEENDSFDGECAGFGPSVRSDWDGAARWDRTTDDWGDD